MTLLSDSWRRAWHALAANLPSPALYTQLIAHYAQPQRQYHTLQHLAECIAQLEPALGLCAHPGEVEIALWFHDAIYQDCAESTVLQDGDAERGQQSCPFGATTA